MADFLNGSISAQRAGTGCYMYLLGKNALLSQAEVSIKYLLDPIEFLSSRSLLNSLFPFFIVLLSLPPSDSGYPRPCPGSRSLISSSLYSTLQG